MSTYTIDTSTEDGQFVRSVAEQLINGNLAAAIADIHEYAKERRLRDRLQLQYDRITANNRQLESLAGEIEDLRTRSETRYVVAIASLRATMNTVRKSSEKARLIIEKIKLEDQISKI